jgi:hypothetical protein
MSQGSLICLHIAKSVSGFFAPLMLDGVGLLMATGGGTVSAVGLTAAAVIKAAPGRIARIVIVDGGKANEGEFTFNDAAATGNASAANTIISIPAGVTGGTVFDLDWPCANGIALSAVPSAGSPALSVTYV